MNERHLEIPDSITQKLFYTYSYKIKFNALLSLQYAVSTKECSHKVIKFPDKMQQNDTKKFKVKMLSIEK